MDTQGSLSSGALPQIIIVTTMAVSIGSAGVPIDEGLNSAATSSSNRGDFIFPNPAEPWGCPATSETNVRGCLLLNVGQYWEDGRSVVQYLPAWHSHTGAVNCPEISLGSDYEVAEQGQGLYGYYRGDTQSLEKQYGNQLNGYSLFGLQKEAALVVTDQQSRGTETLTVLDRDQTNLMRFLLDNNGRFQSYQSAAIHYF